MSTNTDRRLSPNAVSSVAQEIASIPEGNTSGSSTMLCQGVLSCPSHARADLVPIGLSVEDGRQKHDLLAIVSGG